MILFKGFYGKALFLLTAFTFSGVCVREILGVNVNFYLAALIGIIGFVIAFVIMTVIFILISSIWDATWDTLKEKWGEQRGSLK